MKFDLAHVLSAVVVPLLGYLAVYLRARLQASLTPARFETVEHFAEAAVVAAEKAAEALGMDGAAKYAYAETGLVTLARRVGVKLKPEEANTLIHATLAQADQVFALNKLAEAA